MSVRKKSRLAGGIELFSISDVVIHQGRSNLGILTGAKMLQFFGNIISDLARLELAAGFMKKLDRASEQIPSPDHYDLLVQSLKSLNLAMSGDLVSTWFILNLARINGETINFFSAIQRGMSFHPTKPIFGIQSKVPCVPIRVVRFRLVKLSSPAFY